MQKARVGAFTLQNFSLAAWVGGVALIAGHEIWRAIPPLPWF
jgi:hypothetical protein